MERINKIRQQGKPADSQASSTLRVTSVPASGRIPGKGRLRRRNVK